MLACDLLNRVSRAHHERSFMMEHQRKQVVKAFLILNSFNYLAAAL
jgi:hypothetical protein